MRQPAEPLPDLRDRGALGPFEHAERSCYDNASWVGFRLAEMLPLEPPERQQLLQVTDPVQRLSHLMHYVPRFQRA